MIAPFRDRTAAGEALAPAVRRALADEPCAVLAIPRGGALVAAPIARALGAPLGLVLPRKVGAPGRPELAIGAVAPGGIRFLDHALIGRLGIGPREVEAAIRRAEAEVVARARAYGDDAAVPLEGRTAVLVDDGIATGATAVAAARSARARDAARVVLAAPVAPPGIDVELGGEVDALVVLETPSPFVAVGRWYERFDQTTDDEVRAVLRAAR